MHALIGFLIIVLTYVFVIYLLFPYGFNVNIPGDWEVYAHGIVGCMMLGFVVMMAAFGLILKSLKKSGKSDINQLRFLRNAHRFFGYFLVLVYKAVIIYAWRTSPQTAITLTVW